MKNLKLNNVIKGILMLVIGMTLGWLLFSNPNQAVSNHQHEGENTTWTCSMHPQIRQEESGLCPICGMDLVTVNSLDTEMDVHSVSMTNSAIQLANIQTTTVGYSGEQKSIYLPGEIVNDETRLAQITAHFAGRIEKLYVNFTGQQVQFGQRLATIYSPELVTAQKELFEALKFKETNPGFYDAAINKLKLWDITDDQIERIITSGEPRYNFDVLATQSGTVLERKVEVGDHVMEGTALFEIASLDHVWAEFDVYEKDLSWIHLNDTIVFTTTSVPGKEYRGTISFIDPVIDPNSRTANVRVEVANANRRLKTSMLLEGELIVSRSTENSLSVPKSAVLWTGKRSVVYVKVANDPPTFSYREIVLGAELGSSYEVISGLSTGEEIVTNGVFKVDAAAQLEGKTSMMNSPQEKVAAVTPVEKDSTPQLAKNLLSDIFEDYLPLKTSLVEDDLDQSKSAIRQLEQSVNAMGQSEIGGGNMEIWLTTQKQLSKALKNMKNEESIEQIRTSFSTFSEILYQALINFEVEGLQAYRQYCPMAFNNQGAFWLSDNEEILNPYFGDKMLHCGSITEVLE